MSQTMKPYVIRQGDYLTRLAHRLGFARDEVWNHPQNAELQSLRGDPDMLKAGDILFVPDEPRPRHPFSKEAVNRYVAEVPRLPVAVVLTHNDEPLADTPFVVTGLREEIEGTTDADGRLEVEVDVGVTRLQVELDNGRIYRIQLGDLDPADEPSGARQRLTQLGLYSATTESEDQYVAHNPRQFRAALRAFQRQQGLEASGELDEATVAALRAAYGA